MQSDTKRIDMKTRKNLMFQDLNLKKIQMMTILAICFLLNKFFVIPGKLTISFLTD